MEVFQIMTDTITTELIALYETDYNTYIKYILHVAWQVTFVQH